jgi:hypothetical protein
MLEEVLGAKLPFSCRITFGAVNQQEEWLDLLHVIDHEIGAGGYEGVGHID